MSDVQDLKERAMLEVRARARDGVAFGESCLSCGDNIWRSERNTLTEDGEPTIMICVSCGNQRYE